MMPQATAALRRKFPGADAQAMKVLEKNFTFKPGEWIYRKKNPRYKPTQREFDALDYMFQEWDWNYSL